MGQLKEKVINILIYLDSRSSSAPNKKEIKSENIFAYDV